MFCFKHNQEKIHRYSAKEGKFKGWVCHACDARNRNNSPTMAAKYARKKANAKKRGIPYLLTLDEFSNLLSKSNCDCCGRRFSDNQQNDKLTIDRLDPKGPYSNDNTNALCWRCNRRKDDCSLEELKQLVAWIESKQ